MAMDLAGAPQISSSQYQIVQLLLPSPFLLAVKVAGGQLERDSGVARRFGAALE